MGTIVWLTMAVATAMAQDTGGGVAVDPVYDGDGLVSAAGCAGLFNPEQVLDLTLDFEGNGWSTVLADKTFDQDVPAWLSCGDEAPIYVAVHRKRSGVAPKVALSIDVNEYLDDQTWHGLKKVSLENGASEGDPSFVRRTVSEYLLWRLMGLSGAIASRAALVDVQVEGDSLGVYTLLEGVDKTFLSSRFGDKSGWLLKKSGSVDDGYRTNETQENPYAAWFSFWEVKRGRLPSSETLAAELPARLDIEQMLTVGAVNAMAGNADGPIFKDNNYYRYDWAGGRAYLPWDVDSSMNKGFDVFLGGKSATTRFTDVLFTHWKDDYAAILTRLADGPLAEASVEGELERIRAIAAGALDADPYLGGGADVEIDALIAWWRARLPQVRAQVAGEVGG